jgi:hypothetical protein
MMAITVQISPMAHNDRMPAVSDQGHDTEHPQKSLDEMVPYSIN